MEIVSTNPEFPAPQQQPNKTPSVLTWLAPLLKKHIDCHPTMVVPAEWVRHFRQNQDLVNLDLSAAGATVVRLDALIADVRREADHRQLRLANISLNADGDFELLLPRKPKRNLAVKRYREVWDNAHIHDDFKDDVIPLTLQKADPNSPLARARNYLCTDLSEIRFGDRPLDMAIEATIRGVKITGFPNLSLSDFDYILRTAQVISAKYAPEEDTRIASVEVIDPGHKDKMAILVHVIGPHIF